MFINFAFYTKRLLTASFRYNWKGKMDGIKRELGEKSCPQFLAFRDQLVERMDRVAQYHYEPHRKAGQEYGRGVIKERRWGHPPQTEMTNRSHLVWEYKVHLNSQHSRAPSALTGKSPGAACQLARGSQRVQAFTH